MGVTYDGPRIHSGLILHAKYWIGLHHFIYHPKFSELYVILQLMKSHSEFIFYFITKITDTFEIQSSDLQIESTNLSVRYSNNLFSMVRQVFKHTFALHIQVRKLICHQNDSISIGLIPQDELVLIYKYIFSVIRQSNNYFFNRWIKLD